MRPRSAEGVDRDQGISMKRKLRAIALAIMHAHCDVLSIQEWRSAFLIVIVTILSSAVGPAIAGQGNAFEQHVLQQTVPSNRDDAMLLAYELEDARASALATELMIYVRRRDVEALRGNTLPAVTVKEAIQGPYGGHNFNNQLEVASAQFLASAVAIDFTASFPEPHGQDLGAEKSSSVAMIPGLWRSTGASTDGQSATPPATSIDTLVVSHLNFTARVVFQVRLSGASVTCPETVLEAGSTAMLTCPVEWRPLDTVNDTVRPDPYAVLVKLKEKGATAAEVSVLLWAGTPPHYVASTWEPGFIGVHLQDLDIRRRAQRLVASLTCVDTGSCPVPADPRRDYRAQGFLAVIAFIMALAIALRLLQRRSGVVDGWPWWISQAYFGLATIAVLLHLVDNPTHASPQSPWTGLLSSAVLMILDLPWTLVLLTGSTQDGFITANDSPALLIFLALNMAFLFAMSAFRSPQP